MARKLSVIAAKVQRRAPFRLPLVRVRAGMAHKKDVKRLGAATDRDLLASWGTALTGSRDKRRWISKHLRNPAGVVEAAIPLAVPPR